MLNWLFFVPQFWEIIVDIWKHKVMTQNISFYTADILRCWYLKGKCDMVDNCTPQIKQYLSCFRRRPRHDRLT